MTRQEFAKCVKTLQSCGGANPDEQTLEVWYKMLAHLHPADCMQAVVAMCKEIKELARINFVAEVLDRAGKFKDTRISEKMQLSFKNQYDRMKEEAVPEDQRRAFLKKFKADMAAKGIGNFSAGLADPGRNRDKGRIR